MKLDGKQKILKWIGAFCGALLITIGLSVDYSTLSTFSMRENVLTGRNPVPWALLCVLLACLLPHIRRIPRVRGVLLPIFAATFGFLSVCAQSLYYYDTFEFLTKGVYQAVLSLIAMGSYAYLYMLSARVLFHCLDAGKLLPNVNAEQVGDTVTIDPATRRFRLIAFLCILLCWLPWMVAFYPGIVTWDMFAQLQEFFGTLPLLDDHPVASTYIMGLCMRLGLLLGSGNVGAFLYMLLQSLVCTFAFAVSVEEMGKLGCSKLVQWAAVLFFALMPIWPMYARMGHKDFLFTGVCLLFTVYVTRAVFRREEAFAKPKDYVCFGALALWTCLLRKNGIAVVLPSAVLVVAVAFPGKRRKIAGIALGSALLMYAAFQLLVLPALGIEKGSSRELYSIPFQQTARYFREHADSVTQQERDAVGAVLDAETIAERYVSVQSDPVKATCHAEVTKAYLFTWAKMGLQDPTCYFAALLSGNYGYYLFTPRIWYNDSTGPCFWYDWKIIPPEWVAQFSLSLPESLSGARTFFRSVAEGFADFPLVGMLYQNALYAVLTWLCAFYMLRKKKWKACLSAVPALCTFLLCFGMPVNACLRYFLPVVASTPLLLASAAHVGRRG